MFYEGGRNKFNYTCIYIVFGRILFSIWSYVSSGDLVFSLSKKATLVIYLFLFYYSCQTIFSSMPHVLNIFVCQIVCVLDWVLRIFYFWQLQTGWFTSNVIDSLRLRVAQRFLSLYPDPGARSLLKSVSNRFERSKRVHLNVKDSKVDAEEKQADKGSYQELKWQVWIPISTFQDICLTKPQFSWEL